METTLACYLALLRSLKSLVASYYAYGSVAEELIVFGNNSFSLPIR